MPTIRKPKRITGNARPDPYDHASQARAERGLGIAENMWVDTGRQRIILNDFRKYMRNARNKGRGKPLGGRRLSQFSQAGKSAIAERLIQEVEQEAMAAGETPNPYQVIHVTISARMTLKMLFLTILNRLADDFLDEPRRKTLNVTQREAQGIRGKSADNVTILEQ